MTEDFEVGSRNAECGKGNWEVGKRKEVGQKAEDFEVGSRNAEVGKRNWECGIRQEKKKK